MATVIQFLEGIRAHGPAVVARLFVEQHIEEVPVAKEGELNSIYYPQRCAGGRSYVITHWGCEHSNGGVCAIQHRRWIVKPAATDRPVHIGRIQARLTRA